MLETQPMFWVVGTVGLVTLGCAVAVLAGRRHLRRPTVGLAALTLLLGLEGLLRGIIRGSHSVGREDPAERIRGVMSGLAPGLNSMQIGLLLVIAAVAALVLGEARTACQEASDTR